MSFNKKSTGGTKNVIEDEMTVNVDIHWRIFENIAEKFKLRSQDLIKQNF